jgi:hypothetical protein
VISRRVVLGTVLGASVTAWVSACGGGDTSDGPTAPEGGDSDPGETPGSKPLTAAQLDRMASLLFDNYDAGGATFAYAGKLTGDDSLALQGEIDWKNHVGHATVVSKAAERNVVEVIWGPNVVLERRPTLNALAKTLGRGDFDWVARPATESNRELDAALAIVTGLASQQRDNPQLFGSKAGSAFLRTDTLRETPVEVLRFGERVIFWVSTTDGTMMRLESNSENGLRPRVVDILTRGTQTIREPEPSRVVDVALLNELYEADTSS